MTVLERPARIPVSGAGVAGLTLAYWLNRWGFTPVLIESSKRAAPSGYGIDFYGTAFDVATRMGVAGQLQQYRIPMRSLPYVNDAGKPLAALQSGLRAKILGGDYLPIMHTDLERVLLGALNHDVDVRYSQSITAVKQGPAGVTVTFADGSTETFDALIGADGVRSATRRLVFGPDERFVRHLGYSVACYPLAGNYGLDDVRIHYSEPGRQVVTYCRPGGGIVALFLYRTGQRRVPREQRLNLLRETFSGAGWITSQLNPAPPTPPRSSWTPSARLSCPPGRTGARCWSETRAVA